MELLQLEYFVKVATLQSISKAAQNLHISQSSLSQTIAHLEKELGAQLFDRIGRNIYLNEKGKLFLDGVQHSLKELSNVSATVRGLANYYTGHLSLGVFASPYVLADCISRYASDNPYVNFSVTTHLSTRNQFHLTDFDLVIYHANPIFSDFEEVPILADDIYAILPKEHPLAGRASIRLEELKDESFVSFSVNHNTLEPNLKYCKQYLFQPKVKYYTDSTLLRRIFMEQGAVGFASGSSLQDFQDKANLTAVLVLDAPKDTLCIGWHKGLQLTPTAQHFKEYMLDYFHVNPASFT